MRYITWPVISVGLSNGNVSLQWTFANTSRSRFFSFYFPRLISLNTKCCSITTHHSCLPFSPCFWVNLTSFEFYPFRNYSSFFMSLVKLSFQTTYMGKFYENCTVGDSRRKKHANTSEWAWQISFRLRRAPQFRFAAITGFRILYSLQLCCQPTHVRLRVCGPRFPNGKSFTCDKKNHGRKKLWNAVSFLLDQSKNNQFTCIINA